MYKYKTEPFKHQRQSLIEGAEPYNFAYFMEMGTGKTKVAIDNAAYLYQAQKIDYVFVIAPNSVYQNWKNRCRKSNNEKERQPTSFYRFRKYGRTR